MKNFFPSKFWNMNGNRWRHFFVEFLMNGGVDERRAKWKGFHEISLGWLTRNTLNDAWDCDAVSWSSRHRCNYSYLSVFCKRGCIFEQENELENEKKKQKKQSWMHEMTTGKFIEKPFHMWLESGGIFTKWQLGVMRSLGFYLVGREEVSICI